MDDFPVRSMTTLSSAFMSSSRARTVWSVSLAVGCRETVSGVRRDARESAGVCRVCDPFYALHSPRREPGTSTNIITSFVSFYPGFCRFWLPILICLTLFHVFYRSFSSWKICGCFLPSGRDGRNLGSVCAELGERARIEVICDREGTLKP